MGRHVFISYSHKDAEYVARLKLHLVSAGIEVWTDEGIPYGTQWAQTIEEHVRSCAVLVPVMTPNSRDAEWVANEILLAQQLRKPILPLLLAGERFVELLSKQGEDVTDGRLPSDRFVDQLRVLTSDVQPAGAAAAAPAQPGKPVDAGSVVAWGDDSRGQATVPPVSSGVVMVAAGMAHSIAVHSDGRVTAWGANDSPDGQFAGQATVPAGLANVVLVAAGGAHNVVLHSDGRVTAWGSNEVGQCDPPPGLRDGTSVAAGSAHSLVVHRDGQVTGWGYDEFGQASVPSGLRDVVAVAAGFAHSLALHRDGHVTGWGYDEFGQASVPRDLYDVIAVSAGFVHGLALHRDGRVTGWGANHAYWEGLVPGSGVRAGQASVPATLRGTAVAAGGFHSLAIARS